MVLGFGFQFSASGLEDLGFRFSQVGPSGPVRQCLARLAETSYLCSDKLACHVSLSGRCGTLVFRQRTPLSSTKLKILLAPGLSQLPGSFRIDIFVCHGCSLHLRMLPSAFVLTYLHGACANFSSRMTVLGKPSYRLSDSAI